MKPIIAIAFDGACFTSNVQQDTLYANDLVDGTPTAGLFEFLEEVSTTHEVAIVSPRCRIPQAREAIRDWFEAMHTEWLAYNNKPPKDLDITIREHLPDYSLFIDPKSHPIKDGTWPRFASTEEPKDAVQTES